VELVAKVLTVSDGVAAGTREDLGGPALERVLLDAGYRVAERRSIPDGREAVRDALRSMAEGFSGLIVTTGGTGFSPRDLTPEGTADVLEREAPGLGELMRSTNRFGALSRGRAGTLGTCILLNTPGSPTGAVESLEVLLPLLAHALSVLCEPGAPHPPETGGSTATSS